MTSRLDLSKPGTGLSRRTFLQSAAVAASTLLVAPRAARAADAGGKLALGLIGCGGRGSWIADLFQKHGGYELVACADYFQDKADAVGQKFNIAPERRYTGLAGYKRMIEGKLDAVAIISPPHFHAEQASAAVDAGRHVYCAKPIAVDVPGCRSFAASAKKATEKKLAFLVDFQTRANEFYREAVKRVHEGAIGKFTFGEACYHCGALGLHGEPGTPEGRLRNWVFDIALSGDIIVEQNIHSLDVMNWLLGAPQQVAGAGGRKVRLSAGDCWDHFALLFQYPEGVEVTFSSKQYNDGGSDRGIGMDLFGTEGRINTKYGGHVMIVGKNSYAGGVTGSIYQDGAVANIASFHQQVTSGAIENTTAEPSVQSNMISIMGRMAAYTGRPVTWEEVQKSDARLDPKLAGLKD